MKWLCTDVIWIVIYTDVYYLFQRQRTQVNGKILDDANLVHADATAMNGA
jgi:hypothetical protein